MYIAQEQLRGLYAHFICTCIAQEQLRGLQALPIHVHTHVRTGATRGMAAAAGRLWRDSSNKLLQDAQLRLLRSFMPDILAAGRLSSVQTQLGSGDMMNAVIVQGSTAQPPKIPRTLVLAHGFGAGLGFFGIANMAALAAQYERVVAFDWRGMGGSSRPGCHRAPRLRTGCGWLPSFCDSRFTPKDAIRWFVDSFEEFCECNGMTQFDLVGHSLGGYLSAMYAYHHPGRVRRLVLASPAGMLMPGADAAIVPAEALPLQMRLVDAAWSANVTPQQLVRLGGRWRGRNLVYRAVAGRFNGQEWPQEQLHAVSEYLYQITAQPGSGEFALNSLLCARMVSESGRVRPRLFAHLPLEQEALPALSERGLQPLVLFGDSDWLFDPSVQRLTGTIDLQIVSASGHHLYMDNPSSFHDRILSFVGA